MTEFEYHATRTENPGEWAYRGYLIWDAREDWKFENLTFIDGRTWAVQGDAFSNSDVQDLYSSKRACMNAIDDWLKKKYAEEDREYYESQEDPAYLQLKETVEIAFKKIEEAFNTFEAERKK
ncbi:hypothetical protein [Gimesia sp.]|uniref:hypothetical protein n=1 Tax=Gimesia sp. TaxID=2024833 RepID=UPI0032EF466F